MAIASLFGCTPENEADTNILRDFSSTQALLDWFDNGMPESEIDKIAALPGMQLMEHNTLLCEKCSQPSFADALRQFRTDTTSTDIYGISLAYQGRKPIEALMNVLIDNNFCDSAFAYAAKFIPQDHKTDVKFSSYFVPTGWSMGDAYVRNVVCNGNKYSLSNSGEPTSFFNLQIISRNYGDTPEEQMDALKGVTAHEIFHLLFANYKESSSNYQSISGNDYTQQLLSIIHNEGIAHYICYRSDMKTSFEAFEKYRAGAFETLNNMVVIINSDTTSESTKDELIARSNRGNFWNKYGAISGMFMAYHIENELGFNALIKTVELGDMSYPQAYNKACSINNNLPKVIME